MLAFLNRLSCFLLLCILLTNVVSAQTISAATHRAGQRSTSKNQYNLQLSKVKEEYAKKKAIAEMKLKTGCIKPDIKKTEAKKTAEANYKN